MNDLPTHGASLLFGIAEWLETEVEGLGGIGKFRGCESEMVQAGSLVRFTLSS